MVVLCADAVLKHQPSLGTFSEHASYFCCVLVLSLPAPLAAQSNVAAVSQQNELQLERQAVRPGLSGILENLFLLLII